MDNTNGTQNFAISLTLDEMRRNAEEVRNTFRNIGNSAEAEGARIDQVFRNIGKTVAGVFTVTAAANFARQVASVRGEFQQLEVAFKTMLGSAEKADALMQQLVKTAAITPFDLQGVANGAKQLLAYGLASDKVNETLVRLGDIAAGLSIPLNDIVYLYGTTMTQGRLFTQDLRQFMGRGIPLADELAKQFGVTKDKVGELVTAGKVGFPEVQKAIEAMTGEGGKFGGLMEAQSKTITGQISNIEDAISTMFNEIGKANEGIINDALSGVSWLVEHWKDVAIAIESAAVAYGTYKASVMTIAALQGAEQTLKVDTEIEGLKSLLYVKEQSKNADLEAAVASGKLTEAKAMELAALREGLGIRLTALKLKEQEAIAEHESALSAFNAAKKASEAANERLENMDALYQAAEAQGDASYEQYVMEQLQTASADANTAATALNTAEKNLNAASSKRKAASEAVDTMTTQANTVANNTNTASMNIMKLAGIQLTTMLKGMWDTLMANPLILVAGAVAGLGFAIYKVVTAETEAEKATRMYNEALDEQQKKHDEYKEKVDNLVKAVEDNTKSEGERLQAFEALKAEYPTILNNLLTEAEYLKEIAKYKKLIAEEDNNRAKQSDEEILEEARRKLKYYQDVRKRGTSSALVDMDGNGWAFDNVEDAIKAQQEIVNKAIAKVASHDVTSFLENIKNMKDEDIVAVIDGINNSLKALGKSGDDAIAIVTELGGEYSKQQISTIKNALETEQKERSGEKKTGKGWIEQYKKAYLEAKKEYDDFRNTNNELSVIEYEKKLKELKDKKDEAEKKYKEVGGITGSSLTKQENQAEKEADARLKAQEKLDEELLSLERQNQQDDINLKEDGTEKKLAQIKLDFAKQEDAIKKQAEEWKKANKEAGITDVNANGLTTKQQKAIDDANKLNADARKKAEEDALKSLLDKYQDYSDQRLAIERKFNEDIIALQEARRKAEEQGNTELVAQIDRSIATANFDKGKALAEHDYEMMKRSPEYVKAFEDLANASDEMLKSLIRKFEDAKNEAAEVLDPQELKAYTDTLQRMYDELDNRNPFKAMTEAMKELADTQKEVNKAQDIFDKVKDGVEVINEATGKAYTQAEASELLANAKDKERNAYNRLLKSTASCAQSINSFAGTLTQLGESIGGRLGESISAVGGILGSAGSVFDSFKDYDANAKGLEKTMEQVSLVASVASSMFDMNKQLDKLLPSTDSLYERYAAQQREINDRHRSIIELEIAQLEERLNDESWFYENGLTGLRKLGELNKEYLEAYGKVEAMPQEIYKNKKSGIAKWGAAIAGAIVGVVAGAFTFGAGSALGAALGGALASLGATVSSTVVAAVGSAVFAGVGGALGNAIRAGIDGITYDKGQTAAVNNLRVETRKKSFFKSQKTQDLESWVRENWGEELFEEIQGNKIIDPEVARKILEDGPKLVGETRETVEQLLEYSEKIHEFMEQIQDYVSEAFGPLADNLTDALWDWLSDGKDVMDSFRKYAADTFKKIADDALKAMIQKQIFEPFQKQLENLLVAYSTGQISEMEYMAAVADFATKLQGSIENELPVLQNAMDVINTAFGNAGIDLKQSESESSERTATAKGIAQASQDSVDELNGRFTAIQGHTFQINESLTRLAELQQTHLPFLQNLSYLAPIEENTYYCRRLDGMDTDLRAIKQTLENIELRGIPIKA